MKKHYKLLLISLILLASTITNADDKSNAKGFGMSNSCLLSSFGVYSFGINPANFDYSKEWNFNKTDKNNKKSKNYNFEFSILSVGGGYGSDSSMSFYNNYLNYLSINRNTFVGLFTSLDKVLEFRNNVLPGQRTDVNFDFELKWFSFNYVNKKLGAVNLTMTDKVGLNTNVYSRDEYLPMTFNYVIHPDSKYDLTNVKMSQAEAIAWWMRKYSLGYAKQFETKGFIKNISVGFSVSLVHGYGNVTTYNSTLDINTYGVKSTSGGNHVDSIKGKQAFYSEAALTDFFRDYKDGAKSQFTFFPKPAGIGYGIDFGLSMQLGEHIKIGASVTDLGKIDWNYNTFVNYDTNTFLYKNFLLSSADPTYNRLVNDLEGLDTRDTTSSYKSDLPTKFRAGILYKPNQKWTFELDWTKGNNNLPGNDIKGIISAGAEFIPVEFLPLRTGFSFGGADDFNLALGFGIKYKNLSVDLGTNNINHIISNKRFSISFNSIFNF